jgi:hypothetical protein
MPVEPSIIPRSIASAGLLAFIMIQKYEDHSNRRFDPLLQAGKTISKNRR